MPKYTSSKPNSSLSFLVNYISHGQTLFDKHSRIFASTNDHSTAKNYEPFASLNVFTPFRDRYDFTDEVLGATLLPLAGVVVSVACTVWAIKELFHALAITINLVNKDDNVGQKGKVGHGTFTLVLVTVLLALLAAVVSLAALIKCPISLLTRPIATLGNAIFNSTPENQDQIEPSQQEEEERFTYAYDTGSDAVTMSVHS